MPTYERLPEFIRNLAGLSPEERARFKKTVLEKFIPDLKRGKFRAGLRVRKLEGWPDVYEMTWAPDGRAAFRFGESIKEGEPHIIWLAVGGHEIFP